MEKGLLPDLPRLEVQLFGSFSLVYNGAPAAAVNSARLQSLLAYLILHAGIPQLRQHVAFVLWPDASEAQARNNLRQFLHQLRHALPDAGRFLTVDASNIYWKIDAAQSIDVLIFGNALKEAGAALRRGDEPSASRLLERAADAYQGDLLPGCYDEWIIPERERFHQQCQDACRQLVDLLEKQREIAAALVTARQLLHLDPLDENAYAVLMRLHNLNGDHAAAQRTYQTAVETLQRELGIEPGPALQEAYSRLKQVLLVTSAGPAQLVGQGQLKLVGRQAEWRQMQASWQRAGAGGGHLLLITGEAGIGKSRLAEELFDWAARQGFTAAYTRSYGAEGKLALAPVTDWLRSRAVRPYLALLDPVWLTEIARLLPELLSEHPQLPRPAPITEYGRRQRFFEALARGILAAPHPHLLWIDDLQWCDQETLEWLHFLLRFETQASLLILGTARSEESPPDHPLSLMVRQLQAEDRVAVIELSPLDAAETGRLASLVQGHALDDVANLHLYRETEGNPLFVVEVVRAGLERPAASTPDLPAVTAIQDVHILPPRVQAVIAGRLAQLSPNARKAAALGAAVGRSFKLDLLLHAGYEDEAALIQALDELWQKRIMREQAPNEFDFTHDKLREVAYAEIGLPQRRLIHRRIAQALEVLYAQEPDLISSQLAVQYEQAGLLEQAIPYYQQAGAAAASVYANQAAIELFTRGLELLERMPGNIKRDERELEIQLALATLYRLSKGWASPEEERVMSRAMLLCDKVGNVEQRIRTLFGLQTLYVVQAQYEKVERTYRQAEKLFWETRGTPPPPFIGINLAGARLFMGQFQEAREQFDAVTAVRDEKHIRDLQESQGLNYLVHGLAWNSHALWCLGYPRAALESAQSAVEFARQFMQPFNLALAITYLAMLQVWSAGLEDFRAVVEDACEITNEHQALYYLAWSNILLSFARTLQQPDADSLSQLSAAIEVFTGTGAHVRLPVYFSFLAQACLKAGQYEAGLDALEMALSESLQNNEHWWDAEIHRLRGELMWAQGAEQDDVEAVFQRALETARSQGAKSLELRAATSLARLWQAQSRLAEARACLQGVYAWFTEGFDTPDLQAAQALIAQL